MNSRQAPASDAHTGVLAIRTFGGACPEWAQSFQPLTGVPNAEIIIVRDAPDDFPAALSLSDTADAATPLRILVVDETLPVERFKCPGAIWIVSAPARDLDAIAEANMKFVCGPIFIGVALSDVMKLAGTRDNAAPCGRGVVVPGMYGNEALLGLRRTFHALAESGFDRLALIQANAKADYPQLDLCEVDRFATDLLRSEFPTEAVLTCYTDAVASAWIVIAFKPNAAALERHEG